MKYTYKRPWEKQDGIIFRIISSNILKRKEEKYFFLSH